MGNKAQKISGYVFYRGASKLDPTKNIVGILTLESSNDKTGNMASTWYLVEDIAPQDAQKSGEDSAICGKCPHRGGSCYVLTFQAPLNIWKNYQAGKYPDITIDDLADIVRMRKLDVRFGAYGDPASVATEYTAKLAENADTVTGYTHQWMHKHFDAELLRYCMASVDNEKQTVHVAKMHPTIKPRYYRVKREDAPLIRGEIECPHYATKIQCRACGLCDGSRRDHASIVVNVHGAQWKQDKFNLIAKG
jgi:hypothetical protein